MADMLTSNQQPLTIDPPAIPLTIQTRLQPPQQNVTISQPPFAPRSSHLDLHPFSPVNQKGHFEFDRVLMSGVVRKRTRKTKVLQILRFSVAFMNPAEAYELTHSNGSHTTLSSAPTSSQSTNPPPKNASSNN